MPNHARPWAHRVRDWVLLIAGGVLITVEIVLHIANREVSVPMMTAALTCWGLVPALRRGETRD